MKWKEITPDELGNGEPFVQATFHYHDDKAVFLRPIDESPSTEVGQQGVDRGNIIWLLQWIQENNWHWEEDNLLGDIWYQENESGKSEVLNSGMLADKFISESQPQEVGQDELWDEILSNLHPYFLKEDYEPFKKEFMSKFTLIKK